MNSVTLKLNMGRAILRFLDTGIGGKTDPAIEGYGVTAHERVEWQEKICVTYRGLYPSLQGGELLVI